MTLGSDAAVPSISPLPSQEPRSDPGLPSVNYHSRKRSLSTLAPESSPSPSPTPPPPPSSSSSSSSSSSHIPPNPVPYPSSFHPRILWSYLVEEMAASDEADAASALKRERISNFVHVPSEIEHLMLFGYGICLDSLLHAFTILPLRTLVALREAYRTLIGSSPRLRPTHRLTLLKSTLLILCSSILQLIDASRLYHSVRGQSVFKLYVIFNALEIADRLCSSFGHDILDSFFAKVLDDPPSPSLHHSSSSPDPQLSTLGYILLHTIVLFYQCITLNVAINSYNNALLTLLVSNQFAEVKSSVFKRFAMENLFQITCSDIVERFHLSLFVLIIALRNMVELSGSSLLSWSSLFSWPWSLSLSSLSSLPSLPKTWSILLDSILGPCLAVIACEIFVDWLKHAFITKFNHIRPTVYGRFADILATDLGIRDDRSARRLFIDHSPMVARRIGLSSFPLVCLLVRNVGHILTMVTLLDDQDEAQGEQGEERMVIVEGGSKVQDGLLPHLPYLPSYTLWFPPLLLLLLFLLTVALKLLVGFRVFSHAWSRYTRVRRTQRRMRRDSRTNPPTPHPSADSLNTLHQARASKRADSVLQEHVRQGMAVHMDQDQLYSPPVTLENIDRYTLFKSRIP
ncbi:MAG: eukaryotic membrane protein family-domain-containing protein [Piptocephalis tieghemiana]|nr:MAG: eukaryotic membrane protein family-domain-containing protein [Piptocephalis tieghemiana]